MPMINSLQRGGPNTATYIYKLSDGSLLAWGPDAAGIVVATSGQVSAAGLGFVTGLPPLDATHAWQASPPAVVTVTNPASLTGAQFVLLFTPAETAAIKASSDSIVQQYLTALAMTPVVNLGDPTITGGIAYLVSIGLLTSPRAAQILANTPHA